MKQDGNFGLSFAGKYALPVTNTDTERRNFAGPHQYPNMLPLTDDSGTTDTDEKTHETYGGDSGYTRIYGGGLKMGYTNKNFKEVKKGR